MLKALLHVIDCSLEWVTKSVGRTKFKGFGSQSCVQSNLTKSETAGHLSLAFSSALHAHCSLALRFIARLRDPLDECDSVLWVEHPELHLHTCPRYGPINRKSNEIDDNAFWDYDTIYYTIKTNTHSVASENDTVMTRIILKRFKITTIIFIAFAQVRWGIHR